jgi:hypothetical protein
MKKAIVCLVLALASINGLYANPIALPQAGISQLKFDGNNRWSLAIYFESSSYQKSLYDSICVSTSSGLSKIRLDNVSNGTSILVVTSDSLASPLSVNRTGDIIKLYSYITMVRDWHPLEDSLPFGNYPGSTIDSLPTGYSIIHLFLFLYSKDTTQAIVSPFDTAGTCGILRGHIYDKNNNPILNGYFRLDNPIILNNDGTYSTNVYSRKAIFNWMNGSQASIRIDTLEININPGCVYNQDIHLLDSIVTSVAKNSQPSDHSVNIMNYPNPFNPSTNIIVTVPSSMKYSRKQIDIYNTLGQKINSLQVPNQMVVQWNGKESTGKSAASGIYYYRLIVDGKIMKSASMILLK